MTHVPGDQDRLAPDGDLTSRANVARRSIVLAGPSGLGQVAASPSRLGLPDRCASTTSTRTATTRRCRGSTWPAASRSSTGTTPASWNAQAAVAAVEELCRTGRTDAPVYDIATSARTGHRVLELGGSAYFVAEGIFAQEVVAECRRRGLLADAVCVTQHPAVTFVRRLARDLREHRKPPFVLLRRGLHLLLAQRAVVAHARAARLPGAHPGRGVRRDHATRARRDESLGQQRADQHGERPAGDQHRRVRGRHLAGRHRDRGDGHDDRQPVEPNSAIARLSRLSNARPCSMREVRVAT